MSEYTITALVDITITRQDDPKASELALGAEKYLNDLHDLLVNKVGDLTQFGDLGKLKVEPKLTGLIVKDAADKVVRRLGLRAREGLTG